MKKMMLFDGEYIEIFKPIHMILYKSEDTSRFSGSLLVPYGSNMEDYLVDGKKLPFGTAHFLEHMLFTYKNKDISMFFSRLGATCNASTYHNCTTFYFDGLKEHALECVSLLFDMFFHAKIYKRRIRMENYIISREIKDDLTDPFIRLSKYVDREIYDDLALGHNISGDFKDIDAINYEILLLAYNAFYTKDKVTFLAAGAFDLDEILNFVHHYEYPEPLNIKIRKKKVDVNISKRIDIEAFKPIPYDIFHKEYVVDIKDLEPFKDKLFIYKNFFSYLFEFSSFLINGIEEGIIDEDLTLSIECDDRYYYLAIEGSLLNEDTLSYVDNLLKKPSKYVSEEEKICFIRGYYCSGLKATIYPHDILNKISFSYGEGVDPYPYLSTYQEFDLDDFFAFLKVINNSKKTMRVIWRSYDRD